MIENNVSFRVFIGGGVVHSLATHPTGNDIVFARKREFQVWGLD